MKTPLTLLVLLVLLSATAIAGTPQVSQKTVVPEEDRWRFALALPGWMAGVTGDVGIGKAVGGVDVGFGTLVPKLDMIWATRAEASKGRFGILGEFIYMSLSDGAGTDGLIKKADVRLDQYLGDIAVRWRILEGPRGYLDVLAGVRYTNIYQEVSLQGNDEAIGAASADFVDRIGERLRARIEERIGEGQFRNALVEAIDENVTQDLDRVTGSEPRNRKLPNAPLAVRRPREINGLVERIVRRQERELLGTTLETARAAAAADVAAAQAKTAALRSAAQARAAALRATVNQRIAAAKSDLQKKISRALTNSLNQRDARCDDWWDPYIGLRARYNFTSVVYAIGRGDIGGFGVGSDLMWQAEAAIGFQLTRSIFAEVGYRALSFHYQKDGLTYDTITHGAQITLGIEF
jgi:hypothetical protein